MISRIAEKFEFEKLGTNWVTEIISGVALFLSLSYIFVLNPAIFSKTGIPSGAVFFATVLASGLATLAMGLWARLPFALAPGLESNGFFTFVVVLGLGFSWQEALGLVFWSGVLCLVLTWVPVRKNIIDAIPEGLKTGISTTVGIFVGVIGLSVTDLVIFKDNLPVAFGDFGSPKAILLYVGFAIALVLGLRRELRGVGGVRTGVFAPIFPAGMLVAIITATVLARFLNVPSDTPPAKLDEFFEGVGQLKLFSVFQDPRAWTVLLVFFMIDFYGSIGKFIGLTRSTTLQTGGQVKNMGRALYVDGWGTVLGSAVGTSTIITYVESAVAIGQGGRTGVVAIICGALMLASLAFSPLVAFVPIAAVSGVLVYVGWLLLPKKELVDAIQGKSDRDGSLDWFDFAIIGAMAIIAGVTFSLDKSMLVGFALYTIKEIISERRLPNKYLALSTVALAIAMGVQYFVFKTH
ncbi:MAG: NCS2 family permease [Hyphomonas sp.]